MDIESTAHFLLRCTTYITERRTLLSTIENIDNNLLDLCEPVLIRTLLFGSNSFDTDANTNVLNATIEYILSTKRFDEPLFQWNRKFSNNVMNQYILYLLYLLALFVNFYFIFLEFVLFLSSLTILGTWRSSLSKL